MEFFEDDPEEEENIRFFQGLMIVINIVICGVICAISLNTGVAAGKLICMLLEYKN